MKMLVNVAFPIEPFNSMVKNGTAGEIIGRVIDDIKPDIIYFTELIYLYYLFYRINIFSPIRS